MTMPPSDANTPFVLLGHHRSGTNFLTDTLQHHPSVDVLDEPFSMHTRALPEQDLVRWPTALPDDPGSLGLPPGAWRFLHEVFSFTTTTPGTRGIKETILFEKIDWIMTRWPQLRLVVLERDPFAVVHSVLKHPMRKQWGYAESIRRHLLTHRDHGLDEDAFDLNDPLDLTVASWIIRRSELARSRAHEHSHTVSLEALTTRPETTLTELMAFLGHDVAPAQRYFLEESSRESRGGPYSTYRTHDDVLNQWRSGLTRQEIVRIEKLLEVHGVAAPL